MKIFPDFNEVDFIRFVKILEDFRPSEAIVNTIELISQSDSVIGKLASGLIGTGYTIATLSEPIVNFARTSVDSFRELSKAAKELNLSLDKTSDLTTKIELAGGEYEDVRDYVRGVQDAVIKGDSEDPEVLALEKYGVVIQDTNGKLLAFDETLERLYQGYLKARDAGEAEAYVMMTNGQSVHDVLPYFENLAKAKEDMAKIKWATLDYATLGELSNQMKLVDAQTEELKKSLSSLAAPAANIFLKDTLDTLKALTEVIEENREEVIYWSFVFVEGIKSLQDFAKELGGEAKENIIEFGESLKSLEEELGITEKIKSLFADEPTKDLSEEAKENLIPFYTELKRLEEEFGVISELGNFLPEGFTEEIDDAIEGYLVPFYQEIKNIKEELSITNKLKSFLPEDLFGGSEESIFDSILNKAREDLEEFKKANEEAHKEIEKTENDLAGLSYSLNRIAKYKSELENLKFDEQYGKDFSYEKALAQNKLWYEEAMKDAKHYADEQAIIEELYAAKSEQIEQERADKLAEIRESITSADKTALQQKLDSIEKEKESWLKAGMEESEAVELAQKKIEKAYREAAQRAQEHWRNAADIQYSLTHSAFEKELRDIELWKDAQREKADTAEEIAGIVAESAAKEAEAFEREVDRIKGKVQSLEDKIFEQEHSRYENDLRKLAQERYQLYQEGIYSPALIERYYQNELRKLKTQAAQGGEYTKSPTNDGMQRGGNGIVVIGGDQIIDDGLIRGRQEEIGLLVDENKIRAQLLPTLSDNAKELLSAQQAMKNFADTQKFLPPAEKPTNGYQVIEGDKVIEMPESTAYLQEFNSALQQTTAGIEQFALPTPEISAEPLQEFNSALERISSEMASLNPFESIANAGNFLAERLNQAAQDLPTEYFRNLADGAQSVSTMQLSLTDSTMKLIDAQENLRKALANLPSDKYQMPTNLPTDSYRQLSTSTQDFVTMQQDLMARRTRELERLPAPQSKGFNFGFDMDTAGTVLGLGALLAGIGGAPITAPIAAGITALSALGGLAKGTYDNSTEMPNMNSFENIDLTQLASPLANIDTNVQSVLQEIQAPQETTLSFETIVTPLNNISSVVGNILAAMSNRQPPSLNISPNIHNELGGAYVFDERMKKSLIDDITDEIVTAITEAVQSETRKGSYGYSA